MLLKSGFSGLLSANNIGSEIVATSYKPNNSTSSSSSPSSINGSPIIARTNNHHHNFQNNGQGLNNSTIVNNFGKPKIYNNGGTPLIKSEVEPLKSALQQPQSPQRISPFLSANQQQKQQHHSILQQRLNSATTENHHHCLNGGGGEVLGDDFRNSGGGNGGRGVCFDDQPGKANDFYHTNHDEIQLLNQIQDTLKEGWTVHLTENGRLYYCNHITRTSSWLPPIECWRTDEKLPYGWEKALDQKGRPYFINHINKTTTYEQPHFYSYDEQQPPEPRVVTLERDPSMGFGFVAGSEKPVIVRFVTEGSPSVNKLEPGDQILSVDGEDVKDAPRDHVIQLVKSCDMKVTLVVCQPSINGTMGRKSTFLSAGKKAKLRTRPSRVRFAESVCVNGAPLFPPSAFSLGDLCVPPMANVLKVFLENGQTKSFKYDATTTVADVVSSLKEKLCLTAIEHFSLVLEHVKSLKRNKLTLLDSQQTLVKIASRPGAHKLRCLFRISFVPTSAANLAQIDLNALDYLFMQCCNDVTQERFAPELQPDVALRLAALHIHQHILANNMSPTKCTVKTVEQEFGLERFVPSSLIEGMKRKELRRLISHFMKLNSQMTGSSKMLTQLQAKIHYLDIISGLPSYGAKCFSTNQRDGIERVLLVSPRFGLSQITGVRNSIPQQICTFDDMQRVTVNRDDDVSCSVILYLLNDSYISFAMEDRDATEFALVLVGYYRLLSETQGELDLDMIREQACVTDENSPPYLAQHAICPSYWSYIYPNTEHQSMAFSVPPPYHSIQLRNICSAFSSLNSIAMPDPKEKTSEVTEDEFGFDMNQLKLDASNDKVAPTQQRPINGLVEAKNEEVLRRVAEMQKMVENSEKYLSEQGECVMGLKSISRPIKDRDSDCDSMNSSKLSSNGDSSGGLRHSDSLTLLAECISQDFSGISKDLNTILSPFDFNSSSVKTSLPNITNSDQQGTPKLQRKMQQDLNQLLNDIGGIEPLSQSESDSESIYSPNSSPLKKTTPQQQSQTGTGPTSKTIRSSFGLHSPDSHIFDNCSDVNLKEYFKQFREATELDTSKLTNASKKLSEYYGFDSDSNPIIETDPDLIDLTAITPPHTPDELDALTVLETAPSGFDDHQGRERKTDSEDLEHFLAKVIIEPPEQKVTPAKELTPEEIMSFIIPPPSCILFEQDQNVGLVTQRPTPETVKPKVPHTLIDQTSYNTNLSDIINKFNNNGSSSPSGNESDHSSSSFSKNSLKTSFERPRTNSLNGAVIEGIPRSPTVIEYATVDKKGPFSCCSKTKKDQDSIPGQGPMRVVTVQSVQSDSVPELSQSAVNNLMLPPKKDVSMLPSPQRPPKSSELIYRPPPPLQSHVLAQISKFNSNRQGDMEPPSLPPRFDDGKPPPVVMLPPKKPPLPPIPIKPPNLRSPPIHAPRSATDFDRTFSFRTPSNGNSIYGNRETEGFAKTCHYRSNSESPSSLPPPSPPSRMSNDRSPITGYNLYSPQLNRKYPQHVITNQPLIVPNGVYNYNHSNSHAAQTNGASSVNADALLSKTDIAMAGLLVKLDQVAAMCTAAQQAGGGVNIDETKFELTRTALTEEALSLVTASKLLVVALSSDPSFQTLPEHLTSCLTALRKITELAQSMTKHTSSPLQTRNIVLKIHDVASSFRELAGVQTGPLGAGQLALQAECLANVLATLLRSLRVFSP